VGILADTIFTAASNATNPAGSGKTSCYEALQSALNLMHSQHLDRHPPPPPPADTAGADDQEEVGPRELVQSHVINPKSLDLKELYGCYNPSTNEWQDGLASSIVRSAVAEAAAAGEAAVATTAAATTAGSSAPDVKAAVSARHQEWVVFDGPVDALWVESMNTVLDDSCMLCLPNGERIRLDAQGMRMVFEVEDLQHASPATVSRCGWAELVYRWWLTVDLRPFGC
jgi:dynein heavy chain